MEDGFFWHEDVCYYDRERTRSSSMEAIEEEEEEEDDDDEDEEDEEVDSGKTLARGIPLEERRGREELY